MRQLLIIVLLLCSPFLVTALKWIDVKQFIMGKAFNDTSAFYDRLPADRQHFVTDAVWSLSRDTAGMYASFETNTTTMSLNVTYLYDGCEMYHFPTSVRIFHILLHKLTQAIMRTYVTLEPQGVCGMDLYALDTTSQRWRWVSTTTQNEYPYSVNSMTVVPSNAMTKYKLHLPTYNGVVNLKIGVDENAVIDRYDDQKTKKILWYVVFEREAREFQLFSHFHVSITLQECHSHCSPMPQRHHSKSNAQM